MTALTTTPTQTTFTNVDEKASALSKQISELLRGYPRSLVVVSTLPDPATTPHASGGAAASRVAVCSDDRMTVNHMAQVVATVHGKLEAIEDYFYCTYGDDFRMALDDSFGMNFPNEEINFVGEQELVKSSHQN